MNRNGLVNKNKNQKKDEKGKERVEEIIEQMNKTWVKKSDSEVGSGSAHDSVVGTTFGN